MYGLFDFLSRIILLIGKKHYRLFVAYSENLHTHNQSQILGDFVRHHTNQKPVWPCKIDMRWNLLISFFLCLNQHPSHFETILCLWIDRLSLWLRTTFTSILLFSTQIFTNKRHFLTSNSLDLSIVSLCVHRFFSFLLYWITYFLCHSFSVPIITAWRMLQVLAVFENCLLFPFFSFFSLSKSHAESVQFFSAMRSTFFACFLMFLFLQ